MRNVLFVGKCKAAIVDQAASARSLIFVAQIRHLLLSSPWLLQTLMGYYVDSRMILLVFQADAASLLRLCPRAFASPATL